MMSGFDDTYLDGLVGRLREVGHDYDFHENALIYEAAEAITHLRAELAKAREALEGIGAECLASVGSYKQVYARWRKLAFERVDIARAALEDLRDD